jgi:hypothetical protein
VNLIVEQLKEARRRMAAMASERRGPSMSIPADENRDDDLVICSAIDRAIACLDQPEHNLPAPEIRNEEPPAAVRDAALLVAAYFDSITPAHSPLWEYLGLCSRNHADRLCAVEKELSEARAVCGDRYPDARLLEVIHKLRAELTSLRTSAAQAVEEAFREAHQKGSAGMNATRDERCECMDIDWEHSQARRTAEAFKNGGAV